eukprot:GAHX01000526.1.p1 GENE.GAHX01000526.1~~GAHX01000526.1.p1  ORF type:complete len:292 (+),score=65.35 GAHX01000526.1:39-914(+)
MVDLTTSCWYIAQPNSKDYVGPKTGNEALEAGRQNSKVKVWRKGLKAWATVDKTELGPYLEESTPDVPLPVPSPPRAPAPAPVPRAPAPAPVPKSKPKPAAPAPVGEASVNFGQKTASPSAASMGVKLPPGAAGLDLESAFKNMNIKLKKVKTKKPKETSEVNDDLDAGGMLGELAMAQSKFGRRKAKDSKKSYSDDKEKKKKRSHTPKSPEIGLPSRPSPSPASSIPKAPKPHKTPSAPSRKEETTYSGSTRKSNVSSSHSDSQFKDIIKKINRLSLSDWQIKAIKKMLE